MSMTAHRHRGVQPCVCVWGDMHSNIPFIITWGALCPGAAMTATLVFGVQYEKEENSSQEDFPVNVLLWVRAINPPLAAFRPETRITSSQNRPVFGFHRRTRLGASGETLTVSARVCEKEKANTSGSLYESVRDTQVKSEALLSNLLIRPEVKKTWTSLLS